MTDVMQRRLTRRGMLEAAAAGTVVVLGGGYGLSRVIGSSPSAPRYRSRPDINPPAVSVVVPADGTSRGPVLVTASRTTRWQHGPMIVDNGGHLIWFHPQTNGSTNLQVQEYQGKKVLTWWEGRIITDGGYGRGEYVLMGSDYREVARVRAGNGLWGDLHEFVITPQGTALFTAFRPERRDLRHIGGLRNGTLLNSLLQEVDIKTGKVLFEWNAAHHIALQESYVAPPQKASKVHDFFHMNSIDVLPDGNLLISARYTFALYKLDRHTGEVIWRLGGKRSDFRMGKHTKFAFQHHARHHPGGVITVFDDGAGPTQIERRSRAIKLGVDEEAMHVTLLREYLPKPSMLSTSQGSVQVLPNGNVFVGWGAQPYFSEYGEDGGLRFNAEIAPNSNSYRAFRSPWTGQPADLPAIAAERRNAGRVTVYASWNGATEVQIWKVLAGADPQSLEHVGSFARDGFETGMGVNTTARHFAVQAHDGSGRLLGRSRTIRI